jgi:hypothetical protein
VKSGCERDAVGLLWEQQIQTSDTNDTKSTARDIVSIPKRGIWDVTEGNGRFSCASSVLLLWQA